MEAVDPRIRDHMIAAALGASPFDLVLAGGTVVDVGTGELRPADVGFVGPMIASVHEPGSRTDTAAVFDCSGRFVAPGFIDMHVHFESAMLTPGAYAEAVCPGAPRPSSPILTNWRTWPVSRESATPSMPAEGSPSASSCRRRLACRRCRASSCPATTSTGRTSRRCSPGPRSVGSPKSWTWSVSLGGDPRMVGVVQAGHDSGKLVSGHTAGLTGPMLQAYLAAGILSDHEVFAHVDAMEKIRAGMTVELRGAFDWLLPLLVAELAALPEFPTHVVAATDDLFALTLLEEGGIDDLLRRLIRYGMDPVRALRIATYNGAYRLQRPDLGMVAAGRRADVIVMSSLEDITVDDVFTDGRHVATGGSMIVPVIEGPARPPLDTIRISSVGADDFRYRVPGVPDGRHRLRTVSGVVLTEWGEVEVEITDGVVVVPEGHILNVVMHRHGRGDAPRAAGLLAGWGDWIGAIATTLSHDTHNLSVFGRDPEDMADAANAVLAAGGGVAVATGGKVTALLELPIAGILGTGSAREVADGQRAVQDAAMAIGLPPGPLTQPLFSVMVMNLACLTGPHVTDLGLVDGTLGRLVDDVVMAG